MKKNIPGSKDGFKPTNYPKTRKSVKKNDANWVGTELGRVGKATIAHEGNVHEDAADLAKHRKFPKEEVLFAKVTARLPWLKKWYKKQTGKDITSHIIWARMVPMFYTNGPKGKGGLPNIDKEHPLNNPELRIVYERVEKFLAGNDIICEEKAIELGTLEVHNQMRKTNV